MTAGPSTEPAYPVQLEIAYPDRDLNRLTTAFRVIAAIPIVIVAGAIGGHMSERYIAPDWKECK